MTDPATGPYRTNAWRLSAVYAVQDAGKFTKADPLDAHDARMCVEAVLARVIAALENEFHPQVRQNAHPADVITKLFELQGHEGLNIRRTMSIEAAVEQSREQQALAQTMVRKRPHERFSDQLLYAVASGQFYTTNAALLRAAFERWPEFK